MRRESCCHPILFEAEAERRLEPTCGGRLGLGEVNIPSKAGGFKDVSRSKRLGGDADAAPELEPPEGGFFSRAMAQQLIFDLKALLGERYSSISEFPPSRFVDPGQLRKRPATNIAQISRILSSLRLPDSLIDLEVSENLLASNPTRSKSLSLRQATNETAVGYPRKSQTVTATPAKPGELSILLASREPGGQTRKLPRHPLGVL
jgi:hypothetical protein